MYLTSLGLVNIILRVSSKQSNFFFGSNQNKPKLNLFRLFFGLFRETKKQIFRFVSVFRTDIETTETNRINLQTTLSIRVSSKQLTFCSVRTEKNEPQSVSVVFQCVFSRNPKKNFLLCFGVSDRYWNNRNKQNLWYEELNRFIF